ncbi:aminopeptidase [Bacillus sp. 166amftsu]|uniref:aminopeptidase n=1 Tax=Bacillus sp. 166amftsu TaxID=1761753 RepID=UPI0008971BBC|nr:aminopeptidase [Bacillus sp. 166amftsu]SDZ40464.1 Leucyl aminopeptidase (aminopeptidase T) [Bacillus sp. 166amftsu]
MKKNNIEKICNLILQHSLDVQKKERIYLHVIGGFNIFVEELYKKLCQIGAVPYLKICPPEILKGLVKSSSRFQITRMFEIDCQIIDKMDTVITIIVDDNLFEFSDVSSSKRALYEEFYHVPLQRIILKNKKWLTFNYPTSSYAQRANMSKENFNDIFTKACLFNYKALKLSCEPLKRRLQDSKIVQIKAIDTDLSFSLESNPVIICDGRNNLPDGEIFTSPKKESIEGYIRFNAPSIYKNIHFDFIDLTFKNGKVVRAKSNNDIELSKILETDEGAIQIGEFGIGLNTAIKKPLFLLPYDEKIKGSIHLALGQAYGESYNGNDSKIHWDLTKTMDQTNKGELYFDNVMVLKEGNFITDDLVHLNNL